MPKAEPPRAGTPGASPDEPPGRRPLVLAGEASLRRRLVARDEQALVELIEVASPWLLGVTQGMLSDADEAKEVVLETFAAAWDRIGSLGDEHDALLPWLLRIARNRAIDRLRRRRRFRLKLARAEAYGELPPDRVRPVEVDEAAQPGWHVHRSVHAALDALPPEQREAVRLAYFQGLTHSEIAQQLAIPMGTVKTRLRLAFDKLRTALAPIKDWIA
ncbi:MAG TPA: sigma-70 family RNA polymerase sigma factor [Gemmatimonadales bacterium]|nr:sigma-70 family RNA polymerase sigma factor [Gemmatimonadales bacterium]